MVTQELFKISRGRGGTPYDGLYWEDLPKRGTFFSLQVYEMVGISLVVVCKRIEKSVIFCL